MLQSTAKAVSTPLTDFEKWLVGGFGAGIGLLLPKLGELSHLIGVTRTVGVLALLCAALILAVAILILGVQVQASSAVYDLRDSIKALVEEESEPMDLNDMMNEIARGLWWPASIGFNYGRRSVERGDFVAGARLVARLSQIQVWLVMAQLVVALAAVALAASGVV